MISAYSDLAHIEGWFEWLDFKLFRAILDAQVAGPPGNLVELGTYLGRSAVVLGDYLRQDEEFVAVDLFGEDPARTAAERELGKSFANLTRRKFEENYLSIHDALPVVVQSPSSQIVKHVAPGSVRFCHVDASHLYRHVREDMQNAHNLLLPGGVVVFDDYRTAHTPGVGAAVWEGVFRDGLIPVAVSRVKLYGVFSHPDSARAAIHDLISSDRRFRSEEHEVAGHPVLRLSIVRKKSGSATTRPAGPATSEVRLDDATVERLARRIAHHLDSAREHGSHTS